MKTIDAIFLISVIILIITVAFWPPKTKEREEIHYTLAFQDIEHLREYSKDELGTLLVAKYLPAEIIWLLWRRIEELEDGRR